MIELNIIKARLAKFRKQRVVVNLFIIYFAGLAFLLMILAMNFLRNELNIRHMRREIKTIEEKISGESEKVEYIKAREKESVRLLKKMDFFAEESRGKIFWAPILAFTARNVPAGIWLEKFSSPADEKKETVAITIKGYVFPDIADERAAIDRFVRNLGSGSMFGAVYLKEVIKVERERRQVVSFEIECELKQKRSVKKIAGASD
ncbi:MAG: PilN domain-containing protein [Candidatus Omnitrophica bacterium]|nr:PilN domain-containing protein [Candidatus Omnitrophota bacterium]